MNKYERPSEFTYIYIYHGYTRSTIPLKWKIQINNTCVKNIVSRSPHGVCIAAFEESSSFSDIADPKKMPGSLKVDWSTSKMGWKLFGNTISNTIYKKNSIFKKNFFLIIMISFYGKLPSRTGIGLVRGLRLPSQFDDWRTTEYIFARLSYLRLLSGFIVS